MLKAIHAQEDQGAALKKIGDVIEKLKDLKLNEAAGKVETSLMNPDLHGLPKRALAAYSNQQCDGKAQPGNQAQNQEHWRVSGWTALP